jgi:hypothetical protein
MWPFKSPKTRIKVHDERRKNVTDRRAEDSAEFPLRDEDGMWVVTERREGRGRRSGVDDYAAQTGLITPILLGGVLLLAGVWVLLRFGMIDAPSWLPIWILFPETLIDRLF